MKESTTPRAPSQGARRDFSTLQSAKVEALRRLLLETPQGQDLARLKLAAGTVIGIRKSEVDKLVDALVREGAAALDVRGRCVHVVPVQRIPAGRRSGSSKKRGGEA